MRTMKKLEKLIFAKLFGLSKEEVDSLEDASNICIIKNGTGCPFNLVDGYPCIEGDENEKFSLRSIPAFRSAMKKTACNINNCDIRKCRGVDATAEEQSNLL